MLTLPTADRRLEPWQPTGTPLIPRAPRVPLTRTAFAAAHVVSDPLRERNPWDRARFLFFGCQVRFIDPFPSLRGDGAVYAAAAARFRRVLRGCSDPPLGAGPGPTYDRAGGRRRALRQPQGREGGDCRRRRVAN